MLMWCFLNRHDGRVSDCYLRGNKHTDQLHLHSELHFTTSLLLQFNMFLLHYFILLHHLSIFSLHHFYTSSLHHFFTSSLHDLISSYFFPSSAGLSIRIFFPLNYTYDTQEYNTNVPESPHWLLMSWAWGTPAPHSPHPLERRPERTTKERE